MLKQMNRWVALGTLSVVVAGSFGAVGTPAVQAKSGTWKKVAIGAALVTGYGLLSHKKNVAIAGGVVTGLSYLQYRHDKKREDARRAVSYRQSHYSSASPYRYNGNSGYNGYRQTGYSGNNWSNGQHRGWTQGHHYGWSKHHGRKHHHRHCR